MKTIGLLTLAGMLASGPFQILTAETERGVKWNVRRLETSQMRLNDVATNGSGRLVAVGDSGVIRSSDDSGVTWDERDGGPQFDLNGITWTGSRWVAVGGWWRDSCLILTSSDAVNWTSCCLGGMPVLNSVASGSSGTVVVGDVEMSAHSTNLASWTPATGPGFDSFNDLVWTGSRFVGVGRNGMVKTSPDGTTWTVRSSGTTESLESVAWNGSTMVAVGYDYGADDPLVLVSSDGVGWTPVSMAAFPDARLMAVEWTGSRFVAGGVSGHIFTSPDGLSWSHHQISVSGIVYGLCWDGSRLVAVGDGGMVMTTPEAAPDAAADWTIHAYPNAPDHLYDIAQGTVGAIERTVIVGEHGTVLTSDDEGETGSDQSSGVGDYLFGVTATNLASKRFIAVGSSGTIISSPDAVAWSTETSGSAAWLRSVDWFVPAIGPAFAITVGDGGVILSSNSTGSSWTPQTSGTTENLYDIASGIVHVGKPPVATKRIVAVGLHGTILTSSDGIIWDPRTSGTGVHLYGVTARDSGFVAVGSSGVVLTSSDGISWTGHSAGTVRRLYDVAWTGTQLVATGEAGVFFTSPDGSTWTRRYGPVTEDMNAVAALDSGRLAAVGDRGIVLTSDPSLDFGDWIAAQSPPPGEDGPDDDPNGDGVTNILAYGLGMPAVDPSAPDDFDAMPRLVQPSPGRRMLMRLGTNTMDVGDLAYIIEESSTLVPGSWVEVLRHVPGQECSSGSLNVFVDGTSPFVFIEFPESIGERERYFARLRLELTE
jgi:photosystem II stability/assembly factor-like uncharacterized protein